jgi:flagellin
MTSISGISNIGPQAVQKTSDKLRAAIENILSNSPQASDVAALSTASQLQADTAALKQVSGNLVQGESLAQVAGGGATQIQSALQQLQSLAQQAAGPAVNANNRAALNQQAQALLSQISSIAGTTSFNGQNLLNGNLSGDNALSLDALLGTASDTGATLSIGDLSSAGLFNGQGIDLSSANGAQAAISVIGNAISQVTGTTATIGAFQQAIDFASANITTAITNQEAAQATFEPDFTASATQASLATIQYNASVALAAQGNRLSPALLQLIG